jgi:hypothetical protein
LFVSYHNKKRARATTIDVENIDKLQSFNVLLSQPVLQMLIAGFVLYSIALDGIFS